MRYVFYNKTEQEKELITNTLDRWCVPYDKETHEQTSIFGTRLSYDIIIDVKPEKIDWVKEKVQERFDLENSWDLTPVEHPQKEQEIQPETTVPSLFEDLFKPNLGIDIAALDKKRERNKSIIKEIDDIFENQIKPVSEHIAGDKEKLMDYMDKTGIKDRLQNALRDSLGMSSPDTLKDDLISYFENKISNMLDIGDTVEAITKDGIEITYNELPEQMKQDLEQEYGKKLLTSNKCKFVKSKNGIAVIIDQT